MPCKPILLLCSLLAALAVQAQPVAPGTNAPWALLTIADGDVTVLRGRLRFTAAEGQRLQPQDILHTAADARVARLEFSDGQVLDLGPATQVLLQPTGAAWPKERAATAYLARGWAKLRVPRGTAPLTGTGLASATLDAAPAEAGTVLARIEARAAFAYVESGRAALLEYREGIAPRALSLGEGQAYSYSRAEGSRGTLGRPTSTQLGATPRALADSLPLRAALWQKRAAPLPDAMQAALAGDTAAWLDSESALRATMRARFTDVPPRHYAHRAAAKPARTAVAKAAAPARVALLAPARLNEVLSAAPERLALSGSLMAERISVPGATAVAQPSAPSTPAMASPPARRAQARSAVSL